MDINDLYLGLYHSSIKFLEVYQKKDYWQGSYQDLFLIQVLVTQICPRVSGERLNNKRGNSCNPRRERKCLYIKKYLVFSPKISHIVEDIYPDPVDIVVFYGWILVEICSFSCLVTQIHCLNAHKKYENESRFKNIKNYHSNFPPYCRVLIALSHRPFHILSTNDGPAIPISIYR